jgi:ribonuclease VapC
LAKRIVIDSSALLAIYFGEPESVHIVSALREAVERQISSFTFLESSVVALRRTGVQGRILFDSLCEKSLLKIVPFTEEQLRWARSAWAHFGKGRHPASLNLGDCCSYALAKATGLPLLCKGKDFSQTDLDLVPY